MQRDYDVSSSPKKDFEDLQGKISAKSEPVYSSLKREAKLESVILLKFETVLN